MSRNATVALLGPAALGVLSVLGPSQPLAASTPGAAVTLPSEKPSTRPAYPATRKVDHQDVYHGITVPDPYRWLEDDVRTSKEVRAWVEAQNRVTLPYLAAIPERGAIERRLTGLWDYERTTVPSREGGHYFFTRNDGLQNQSVLLIQDSLVEEPRVLLDPNTWSKDGTVALSDFVPSPDGVHAAYSVAGAGSDWQSWRVMRLDTGELLPEELLWTKFTNAAWTADGKGFFYSRFEAPAEGQQFQGLNLNQKLWYHRIGTPQSKDLLVYWRPEQPEWGYSPTVTDDGRYLVLTVWKGTASRYRVYVKDLEEPLALPTPLVDEFENDYSLIDNVGSTLYFQTDWQAPRGRVIAIDLARPGREHWREVVPQGPDVLDKVDIVGNLLTTVYLQDAKSRVRLFRLDGQHVRDLELPGIGSVVWGGGRRTETESFYSFASFATPPSIYRYDLVSGQSTLLRRAEVDMDPADYEVKQVFYTSKDGTPVPMFLAHRKGLRLDGSNPTLLYGYGGFNQPMTPSFSIIRLAWMEMGGVFAVANLRGGSEYGEEWHEAGTKLKKQNVFDDFIAAAEWLIEHQYTRPEKLAVQGGSNGGLLVGAVITQRPELFGAALPAVGVMDMLRFHRFTAGRYWTDDYGSADDPEQFKALYAYSPYHNLEPGTRYPATLVTTADTDDRVVPGHSFKFAAALQAAQAGEDPVLIRIETRAGHGAGKPTSKLIEETADLLAFLVENLDVQLPGDFEGARRTDRGGSAAAPATSRQP